MTGTDVARFEAKVMPEGKVTKRLRLHLFDAHGVGLATSDILLEHEDSADELRERLRDAADSMTDYLAHQKVQ